MNASGEILTGFMVGRSPRLVKLVPVTPCVGNCAKVSKLQMAAKFVQDPAHPGSCFLGGSMRNDFGARITVTNELGAILPGALVTGRFLDDKWMDMRPLPARTARRYTPGDARCHSCLPRASGYPDIAVFTGA